MGFAETVRGVEARLRSNRIEFRTVSTVIVLEAEVGHVVAHQRRRIARLERAPALQGLLRSLRSWSAPTGPAGTRRIVHR